MKTTHKSNTLIANRYRILAKIGEGGFGTVYKARDRQQLCHVVAVKEINMATLSVQEKIDVTDTFNREITLLSELEHKNLPRIFSHFTDPEHWYIVMDYIEGQTLEELLAHSSRGRLSVRQGVKIGIALCEVLTYLHDQDPPIIFRDVKLGNIMYTPWDHLYLIDFGIARRYRPGQARDTGSLGSPGYAAPEQYGRNAYTTTQTDIYGLGATLQTLLTGKEPLDIRQEGLPSDVDIPWKLQALFIQMMDQDPVKRPYGIAEVKNALIDLDKKPRFSFARTAFPFMYFEFFGLNQTGFIGSPFMGPYLLLIPFLFIGYCCFVFMRSRPSRGFSLRAFLYIVWKQVNLFLFAFVVLTNCVSLLYAALVHPYMTTSHAIFLLCDGAFTILVALIFLIVWLKKRQGKPMRKAVQMVAPLQQQKRS